MQGMVDRLVEEGRFGFVRAEDGREFYFQEQGLQGTSFDELAPGAVVEFAMDDQSPLDAEHPTAINVRLAAGDVPEQPPVVNTERGGDLEHEPPDSIAENKVSEASWESFPASDPPAKRQIT